MDTSEGLVSKDATLANSQGLLGGKYIGILYRLLLSLLPEWQRIRIANLLLGITVRKISIGLAYNTTVFSSYLADMQYPQTDMSAQREAYLMLMADFSQSNTQS